MIATIIRVLLAGAWRPIAWALGALGLYVKGRSDAKAKRDMQDMKANAKTIEDVLRETPSDDPGDVIRRRMSDRARKP
jgi:hypothetical protein